MYSIIGLLFCILEGFLISRYGWKALIWSPIGFLIGLFASANIALPVLMGVPKATSLVSQKEMKPKVFLAMLIAPFSWLAAIILFRLIFPTAFGWVINNETMLIGIIFGFIVILFSPFSKKAREDFRSDFDKSYGRFYTSQNNFSLKFTAATDKNQLKQIQAIIKIFSNLYINKIANSIDVFKFEYSDSKFRCMVFCLSTTIKSCEDLLILPDTIQKECLNFLLTYVSSNKNYQEFFNKPTNAEQAEIDGLKYLNDFMSSWASYYDAKESGDEKKADNILSVMMHSIESPKLLTDLDKDRLNHLCWDIEFSKEPMRGAFLDMTT